MTTELETNVSTLIDMVDNDTMGITDSDAYVTLALSVRKGMTKDVDTAAVTMAAMLYGAEHNVMDAAQYVIGTLTKVKSEVFGTGSAPTLSDAEVDLLTLATLSAAMDTVRHGIDMAGRTVPTASDIDAVSDSVADSRSVKIDALAKSAARGLRKGADSGPRFAQSKNLPVAVRALGGEASIDDIVAYWKSDMDAADHVTGNALVAMHQPVSAKSHRDHPDTVRLVILADGAQGFALAD